MTPTHGDDETAVWLGLDCQPCVQRVCPLGHHRCMRDLSVEQVYQVVQRKLRIAPLRAVAA
jgi:heptosyltransferase-2